MFNVYMLIALFILIMVINSVLKNFLRRKYSITVPQKLFRFFNNTHKWVEIISIVLGVILFILYWVMKDWVFFYLLMAFLVALTIFRAFIEYKYEREEREYMITLADAGTWSVIFGLVLLVNFNGTAFTIVEGEIKRIDVIIYAFFGYLFSYIFSLLFDLRRPTDYGSEPTDYEQKPTDSY